MRIESRVCSAPPIWYRSYYGAIIVCLMASAAPAAFLIEIDTDGAVDGALTLHPNFSFGGDTTMASTSVGSSAVGLTPADSIFGGDGSAFPDTYVYSYAPAVDADNLSLATGTPLNDDGSVASGLTSGNSGTYNIYVTWPFTVGVSGGQTDYRLSDSNQEVFQHLLNQNDRGDEWIFLGAVELEANETYTLTQMPSSPGTFVSMRAAAVLFEPREIPEPATAALLLASIFGVAISSRRAIR